MRSLSRPLAVATATFALSAGSALAATAHSSDAGARARTPLTAKIAYETPYIHLFYGKTSSGLGGNAVTVSEAASEVSRISADQAQSLSKLEWLLGAYEQERGDNVLGYGEALVHSDRTAGSRATRAGLTHLRLANYYLGDADSTLGVPHPEYATAPYPGKKGNPIRSSTPLLPKAPARTLTSEAAFATPVLTETILEHVPNTAFNVNESADAYYLALVARMHVDAAQQPLQKEWVDGVRGLLTGDEQIIQGSESISGEPIPASAKRQIARGFTTLRHASSQIEQADARLGVHPTKALVTLPAKVLYTS